MTNVVQSPKRDNLISSAEACQILGRDRSTLSRWVKAGRIKPALKGEGARGPMWFKRIEVEVLASLVNDMGVDGESR